VHFGKGWKGLGGGFCATGAKRTPAQPGALCAAKNFESGLADAHLCLKALLVGNQFVYLTPVRAKKAYERT